MKEKKNHILLESVHTIVRETQPDRLGRAILITHLVSSLLPLTVNTNNRYVRFYFQTTSIPLSCFHKWNRHETYTNQTQITIKIKYSKRKVNGYKKLHMNSLSDSRCSAVIVF